MIKVIVFDLGGVVFTNGTEQFIEWVSKTHGIERGKVTDVIDGEIGSMYREAKITREEFWKIVKEKLKLTEDTKVLEDKWISGYKLIEGTRKLIEYLSKRYKLYYLSDNVRERVEKLKGKYNFLLWFVDGVFSHEVGLRKPNPKIYQILLEKAGVKPDEVVYIDDKPHFLPPAAALGIRTIAFSDSEALRKHLKKIKII